MSDNWYNDRGIQAAIIGAVIAGVFAIVVVYLPTDNGERSQISSENNGNKNKEPAYQKISVHKYFQLGEPRVKPKDWKGPGKPVADFKEVFRGDVELVPNEWYWMPHNNTAVPTEQPCKDGSNVGNACFLDEYGRLSAYTRVTCTESPISGLNISSGCSRAAPLFLHDRKDVMVQCCFYADSPQAKGLVFGHSQAEILFFGKH